MPRLSMFYLLFTYERRVAGTNFVKGRDYLSMMTRNLRFRMELIAATDTLYAHNSRSEQRSGSRPDDGGKASLRRAVSSKALAGICLLTIASGLLPLPVEAFSKGSDDA